MADLDNLNHPSITEMQTDESIDLLRQIRLSRRIPVRKVSKAKTKKTKSAPKIDANLASQILNILSGDK